MPTPDPHQSVFVCHLILRLELGGAEQSLLRLIQASDKQFQHRVFCLGEVSRLALDMQGQGIDVQCFDYRANGFGALWRALAALREARPDVLQGWMYWGNVLVSLLALALPSHTRIAWNVRSSVSKLEVETELETERWPVRLSLWLSRVCAAIPIIRPNIVIFNSVAGQRAHDHFGFARLPGQVIDNGLDLDEFVPSAELRGQTRDAHAVGDVIWVGMLGRYHAVKGVEQFLKAAARVCEDLGPRFTQQSGKEIRFVLAGTGMSSDNIELNAKIRSAGLSVDTIDLVGEVQPSSAFLPALDLLVLASLREGSPNAVLEAMACGVDVVATDVGDIRRILSDDTRIARPGDVADLARVIQDALERSEETRSEQIRLGREVVESRYTLQACVAAYRTCYSTLLA